VLNQSSSALGNGWTLDGEGRAMSKSIGNVIEPEKMDAVKLREESDKKRLRAAVGKIK
jgi:isoleucyl-tRNA synthetase